MKGPICIFLQPELHWQSKPSSELLEALHVPCPQFIYEQAISATQVPLSELINKNKKTWSLAESKYTSQWTECFIWKSGCNNWSRDREENKEREETEMMIMIIHWYVGAAKGVKISSLWRQPVCIYSNKGSLCLTLICL